MMTGGVAVRLGPGTPVPLPPDRDVDAAGLDITNYIDDLFRAAPCIRFMLIGIYRTNLYAACRRI